MRLRRLLLLLLLPPCWVIGYRFSVDVDVAWHVAQHLPADLAHIYRDNGSIGGFFYSPVSLLFLRPFTTLSFTATKLLWLGVQTAAYFVFWGLFARLYPALWRRDALLAWVLVWIASINPIHGNFQSGNLQLIFAATWLFAELATRSPRPAVRGIGGFLCGLTACIKLYPFFLVALYLLTKPRAVRIGIYCAGIAALAVPLLYFGWASGLYLFREFYLSLFRYQEGNGLSGVPDILCLPSALSRLGVGTVPSTALITGLALAYFGYAWRHRTESPERFTAVLALGWALMVFLSPMTRVHYLVFLLPAYASLAERLLSHPAPAARALFFLSLALVAFTAEGVVGKSLAHQFEWWNLPTLGVALLLIGLRWPGRVAMSKP